MERWLWICPVIGVVGAVTLLWLFGMAWLPALGVAFLLSCPALAYWTWREARLSFGLRDRLLRQASKPGEQP